MLVALTNSEVENIAMALNYFIESADEDSSLIANNGERKALLAIHAKMDALVEDDDEDGE